MHLIVSLALGLIAVSASAQEEQGNVADTDTDPVVVVDTVAPPALSPKVAVVVAGDPDESVRTTGREIEQECARAGLSIPADPALRAALRGEAGDQDDGLAGLRSLRRSLGVDPRRDLAAYNRLGAISGADALVVLHREGTIKLEVFDVAASQFYEGVLQVDDTTAKQRVRYIERRAKTAQRRWDQGPKPATGARVDATGKPIDEPEKKRWIKKAWPYFVVGALLAAGVTYLIVDGRRTNEPGPPLLRFRPGDE